MNKKLHLFVDTSFIKALFDPKDEFHVEAEEIWEKVKTDNPKLITTNFMLDEMFTLIRKRIGLKTVKQIKKDLVETKFVKIVRVTTNDEVKAWGWFENDWSDLSFTDCVSFAVMKRLSLEKVLTFDNHFSRAGFEIIA